MSSSSQQKPTTYISNYIKSSAGLPIPVTKSTSPVRNNSSNTPNRTLSSPLVTEEYATAAALMKNDSPMSHHSHVTVENLMPQNTPQVFFTQAAELQKTPLSATYEAPLSNSSKNIMYSQVLLGQPQHSSPDAGSVLAGSLSNEAKHETIVKQLEKQRTQMFSRMNEGLDRASMEIKNCRSKVEDMIRVINNLEVRTTTTTLSI